MFGADALGHFRAEGFFQQNFFLVLLWSLGEFPGHSCLRSACMFLIPEISRQCFWWFMYLFGIFLEGVFVLLLLFVTFMQSQRATPLSLRNQLPKGGRPAM